MENPKLLIFFMEAYLKNELLEIMPLQKLTLAGHQTHFRFFFFTARDYNDHVGLAVKFSKVVVTAFEGPLS